MIYLEKELKTINANINYFFKKMAAKERIVATVLRFDYSNNLVVCKLNDKIDAVLPITEIAVKELKVLYNSDFNTIFYPEIAAIIGKNISAIITSYDSSHNYFVLSRRDSIKKSFEEIKKEEYIYCEIIHISRSYLLADCGYGVPGMLHIKEASLCRIRDLKDSFSLGQIIKCKILSVNEEDKTLVLSRKEAIESENILLHENDLVFGKVREPYSAPTDSSGQKSFFFEILPYNIAGILNTFYNNSDIMYNDSLICVVAKVNNENRYKLKVIKKL